MKIGAMVESFRMGLDGGLKAAAEVGVDGVQIYATGGEMLPSSLTAKARADLRRKIAALGIEISALCGDFGGHGFQVPEENAKRIADSKSVLDLALDLGCRVVTTHIGVVPADRAHARYGVMAKAMAEMGKYAESVGGVFAIETGPEPSKVLRSFLDDVGMKKGLGVNFDPANLVMVIRENIPAAVANLAPYIVHTHAKDGINVRPVDAEQLYNGVPEPAPGEPSIWSAIKEVPLGEGHVNFDTYIPALRKAGFDGYLTIEREVGENPRSDIQKAVTFLKKYV